MNHLQRNRSLRSIEVGERAHRRASGAELGDVAIYIQLRTCNQMLTERLEQLVAPHGLSAVGYITMKALYGRPENLANPSELSDITGETRGNMTRICDELVDKGWLRRVPSASDRRRVELSLTEAGVALLHELVPRLHRDAEAFYRRHFNTADKANLRKLLAQFCAALAEEADNG